MLVLNKSDVYAYTVDLHLLLSAMEIDTVVKNCWCFYVLLIIDCIYFSFRWRCESFDKWFYHQGSWYGSAGKGHTVLRHCHLLSTLGFLISFHAVILVQNLHQGWIIYNMMTTHTSFEWLEYKMLQYILYKKLRILNIFLDILMKLCAQFENKDKLPFGILSLFLSQYTV